MESRLQDHERIRGGLYFIQNIPRDENWKVRRDILAAYDPNKSFNDRITNNETGESDKVVQELNRQPNGSFVGNSYTSQCSKIRKKVQFQKYKNTFFTISKMGKKSIFVF